MRLLLVLTLASCAAQKSPPTPAPAPPVRPAVATVPATDASPPEVPQTFEGDVVITTEEELSALAEYSIVTGTIRIKATRLKMIALPNLKEVRGHLLIRENEELEELDLSSLVNVTGSLEIVDSGSLSHVDGLSSLVSVGEQMWLVGNRSLSNLRGLGHLESVGALNIGENPKLPTCAAESLSRAIKLNQVSIFGNDDQATCP